MWFRSFFAGPEPRKSKRAKLIFSAIFFGLFLRFISSKVDSTGIILLVFLRHNYTGKFFIQLVMILSRNNLFCFLLYCSITQPEPTGTYNRKNFDQSIWLSKISASKLSSCEVAVKIAKIYIIYIVLYLPKSIKFDNFTDFLYSFQVFDKFTFNFCQT